MRARPRYLLAARASQASPLQVHHRGFTEEDASALGERLILGEPLEHLGHLTRSRRVSRPPSQVWPPPTGPR
jgi:hypothetical protein